MALTGIWYIIGFAFAAGSFAFLTFGAAWLVSHRNRGDVHKGLPYESGIDTYGDTHGRFGLSFYIYALLFVAFDIEVLFIESDDGYGPYGAKSMGESSKVPGVAAVGNAVFNAIGHRMKDLPITRDKILTALTGRAGQAGQAGLAGTEKGGVA